MQTTVREVRNSIAQSLQKNYDEREAANITCALFLHYFGWNRAEVILHDQEILSPTELSLLQFAKKKLEEGIPLQYVLGRAYFFGMDLKVSPAVLIPRPETEELVRLVMSENPSATSLLDIGTGSGCIAIALAKGLPSCRLHACDVSEEALEIARANAKEQSVDVRFSPVNILTELPTGAPFDVIVSNPPYIAASESNKMSSRVIAHEPYLALFVEDHDTLLFYRRILEISPALLNPSGLIYFEIHEEKKNELSELATALGFYHYSFTRDMQGKERMMTLRVQ